MATGYLNAYRHRIADLVLLAAADDEHARERLRAAVLGLVRADVPVIAALLRPRPLASVAGKRVACFGTAPAAAHGAIAAHLGEAHGAEVVAVSGALADRRRLREELERVRADVFLVELKAAAIDVVAEEALARGVELVLVANDVVPLPGEPDLDAEIRRLAAISSAAVPEAV